MWAALRMSEALQMWATLHAREALPVCAYIHTRAYAAALRPSADPLGGALHLMR